MVDLVPIPTCAAYLQISTRNFIVERRGIHAFLRMVNFFIEASHYHFSSRNEPQTFLVHEFADNSTLNFKTKSTLAPQNIL